MPSIYCPECGVETEHVTISRAARSAQVTRTTIYNWLNRALLHIVLRPSGRKLVCTRSLVIYSAPGADVVAKDEVRHLRVVSF
jgi:hypothetical protein